jgi:hypothetical protein
MTYNESLIIINITAIIHLFHIKELKPPPLHSTSLFRATPRIVPLTLHSPWRVKRQTARPSQRFSRDPADTRHAPNITAALSPGTRFWSLEMGRWWQMGIEWHWNGDELSEGWAQQIDLFQPVSHSFNMAWICGSGTKKWKLWNHT